MLIATIPTIPRIGASPIAPVATLAPIMRRKTMMRIVTVVLIIGAKLPSGEIVGNIGTLRHIDITDKIRRIVIIGLIVTMHLACRWWNNRDIC